MDGRGVVRPPYPVALRLYLIAAQRWPEVDAAYASVDLIRFPPHRFLNCVQKWCLDRVEPDKQEEWWYQMNLPLPGREKKASPAQIEDEGEGFMSLMATHAANTGRS